MNTQEKQRYIDDINRQMDLFDHILAEAIPGADVDENTRLILDMIAQQTCHALGSMQEAVIALLEEK